MTKLLVVLLSFSFLVSLSGISALLPTKAYAASSHDENFSPETLTFLRANTGLDGEQWDNIMKLINKPEQDSLDWTKYYGYCEDIGDNRGYTIGIFGATTGEPTTNIRMARLCSRNSTQPAERPILRWKAVWHALALTGR